VPRSGSRPLARLEVAAAAVHGLEHQLVELLEDVLQSVVSTDAPGVDVLEQRVLAQV
jgi:hypothetical protein